MDKEKLIESLKDEFLGLKDEIFYSLGCSTFDSIIYRELKKDIEALERVIKLYERKENGRI